MGIDFDKTNAEGGLCYCDIKKDKDNQGITLIFKTVKKENIGSTCMLPGDKRNTLHMNRGQFDSFMDALCEVGWEN